MKEQTFCKYFWKTFQHFLIVDTWSTMLRDFSVFIKASLTGYFWESLREGYVSRSLKHPLIPILHQVTAHFHFSTLVKFSIYRNSQLSYFPQSTVFWHQCKLYKIIKEVWNHENVYSNKWFSCKYHVTHECQTNIVCLFLKQPMAAIFHLRQDGKYYSFFWWQGTGSPEPWTICRQSMSCHNRKH